MQTTFTVHLGSGRAGEALLAALKRTSKKMGISVGELVRRAIHLMIEREGKNGDISDGK